MDARDAAAYQRGHIAGAVNVGDALRVLRNPTTEDFIETERIEAILGDGGVDPTREIVVYSTRGHVGAYFAHFAIRHFGGQNVSVYHDGIDGWADDKRPLEISETRLAPVTLKLEPNSALAVSTAEMLTRLQDKNVQILTSAPETQLQASTCAPFVAAMSRALSIFPTRKTGSIRARRAS